jgi:hypothetical protein
MTRAYGISLSRFHLSWDEFLDLTPMELSLALEDDNQKEKIGLQATEAIIKNICETIRMETFYLNNKLTNLLQVWGSKQAKTVSKPDRLIAFVWDKEKENPADTLKSMKAKMHSLAKIPEIVEQIRASRKRKDVPLSPRQRRNKQRRLNGG